MSNDMPPDPGTPQERPEGPGTSIFQAVQRAFDRPPAPVQARPAGGSPGEPVAAPDLPTHPGLASADPRRRREAIERIAAEGIEPEDRPLIEEVAQVLLSDPDPDMRLTAAQALLEVPWDARPKVERALEDPDDRVRATVVRIAARAGREHLHRIIPMIGSRRWPLAQEAALTAVASVLARSVHHGDVEALCREVAALEPPPLWHERAPLETIARTIGREPLLRELDGSAARRLGAARMLLVVGELQWIRPVAALAGDPAEEVRRLAETAAGLLDREARVKTADASEAPELSLPGESGIEDELISAIARALSDPSEAVRRQGRTTLGMVPGSVIGEWVVRTLAAGSDGRAHLAAGVAAQLPVPAAGPALLARACRASHPLRATLVAALGELPLTPGDLARMVLTVDLANRPTAVRLAWQAGGRSVLPLLVPMLEDPAGAVRTAVLESLAEADDPTTTEEATRLLASDSSAAVRAGAVRALAQSSVEARTLALADALADPDPDVRAIAVEILPRDAPGAMSPQLFKALLDDDERVWHSTLRHLAALPDQNLPALWSAIGSAPPPKRRALLEALEQADVGQLVRLALRNARSPDPADRALAVEIATHAGVEESTAVVLAALSDPDPTVRREAATALTTLRTPEGVEALRRTLSDPQPEVRVAATRALGLIDDDGVPAVLISALKDPEVRVRQMASEALTRWRSPAVARRLAAALGAPDLRRAAAAVLERMDQAAVEPLVETVVAGDAEARSAAAAVLDRISGPQPFVERLASTDPEARFHATEVLGAIGGAAAAEALMAILGDPEIRIRARAATLLGAMGERRAARPLKRMLLSDPVPEVASAAEAALRALGSVPDGED